jgi:hypothetical protein
MPRYLVRGFYLTDNPLVERVKDFIVNARDEFTAVQLTRQVEALDPDVAYFEAEEKASE